MRKARPSLSFARKAISLLIALVNLVSMASVADAYGFFNSNMGRIDFNGNYDLTGLAYGKQDGAIYDFGKVGAFDTLPKDVTNDMVLTAVKDATDDWAKWANIKFDTTALGASGAGKVRFTYAGDNDTATTSGFNDGDTHYSVMNVGKYLSGTTPYTQSKLNWVFKHEFGHSLGLDDLYTTYTEEFVDHPAGDMNKNPNKTASAYKDNVMNPFRFDGNDYTKEPQTFIDNDEIAGITWIWGGKYNQIVTGDLASAWNGEAGRDTVKHHGQGTAGKWTYRGSIVSAGAAEPYIDIGFSGYMGFEGTAYGAGSPAIKYVGNQGGNIERFKIDKKGFIGNFVLKLTSKFTDERRVNSWIVGGSATDFTLPAMDQALAFAASGGGNRDRFAMVFGPVPEPSTIVLLAIGLDTAALAVHRRCKS
jgi:PEP-CTERM motif-containing protein